MEGGRAKCIFESDGRCRIVIWPLINSQGGTRSAEFKVHSLIWNTDAVTPAEFDHSASGEWTFKIKDDNDSL